MKNLTICAILVFVCSLSGADAQPAKKKSGKPAPHVFPTMGKIERIDPALDALLAPGAVPELAADGLDAVDLAELCRESPKRFLSLLRVGLKRAAETEAQRRYLNHVPAEPGAPVTADIA